MLRGTTRLSSSSSIPTPVNPPSSSPPQATTSSAAQRSTSSSSIRTIPGSYGWPVVGPLSDRLDYFWFQGQDKFFRKRIESNKSTVFRTNVPPCFPFFAGVNPNVIAVLDCKSFSHLFDMEIVEKRNILVGDFMPSVDYTGGMRVGVYLDTQEEGHAKAKSFALDIMKRSSSVWVSSLLSSLDTMWTTIDESLSKDGKASPLVPLQKCLFNFLTKSMTGADPSTSSEISESGYTMLDKWVAFQIMPTVAINKFQPLEEIFLHSFAYPFALVKGDYEKLYNFIAKEGKEIVERGQTEFGLTKEETINNLLFNLGFNAFGGFSIFLPSLLSNLGTASTDIQSKLRAEVRANLTNDSTTTTSINFQTVKQMPLVESFVYETLRLEPPVPLQFGRARKDFLLSSHDSMYEVKKGELLCGYQKLVMRDSVVFDDAEKFVHDRFYGEAGRQLLDYLFWSNGPQTGSATRDNKQCAGKDVVPLTAAMFIAYVFQRYDEIACDSSGSITKAVKAKN